LANAHVAPESDPDAAYDEAVAKVDALVALLQQPRPEGGKPFDPHYRPERFASNMTQTAYKKMVLRGKEYIAQGDIIQAVLSQRFARPLHADPFDVYRALRSLNPSPYMFYLNYGDMTLVGASPEILVTEEAGKVTVRPIAGTRKRGATPEEDRALARNCWPTKRSAPNTSCS
jgi:anthranilate synthase component 1